ncbi:hypothetical protein MAL08_19370 [Leptospira noguchii]|uniref:hypothetical protein n=1 Tax=Leptospira noguchii TaxID=28182 RepID=UPI001FB6F219|nr:hypothetical protein [Leptospira noguchii]UOG39761.1 hypothetical protein MAL08_19370 [Leptospira noguchii]
MSLKNSEGIGAKRTQHNAFLWVALWVVSHFNYKICELRRRPGKLSERLPMGRRSGSRCIEFIIRPNFLTSNSRYLVISYGIFRIFYKKEVILWI